MVIERTRNPGRPPARHSVDSGFTLIEITFAILLLAGSLVVLLGLQSAVISRTTQDIQNQRAMMLARYLLAVIENEEIPIDDQDTTGSIQEILGQFTDIDPDDKQIFEESSDLLVRLVVNNWGIPSVDEEAMKRFEVVVSWGDTRNERLQVIFFKPSDRNPTTASGGGGGSSGRTPAGGSSGQI